MEPLLQRSGLLILPEGCTTIPAWQQVTLDCTAVAVSAAIEKLLVKSVYLRNYNHAVQRPRGKIIRSVIF
ncbi:MAG: hypothetical protein LBG58_11685 [Planctomycetaceae bacterium]|jgi:hypothetical protein|nr:hypothetical protein [Planctomycetaceae bacterium]